MINETKVGPLAVSDGTQITARSGKTGETITGDAHAKYYEATSRNTMFGGAITSRDTTVGTATTYTGLVLSNPVNSGVNLVLNKVGYAFTVAFAAGSVIGLMTGYSTTNVVHTSAVTPSGKKVGSPAGIGKLDSSATLPVTPTVDTIFSAGITGAITTNTTGDSGLIDLDGSIVLPPGAFCAIYTSTASGTAGGNFSMSWEEVVIV